jgi:hypothetical protein
MKEKTIIHITTTFIIGSLTLIPYIILTLPIFAVFIIDNAVKASEFLITYSSIIGISYGISFIIILPINLLFNKIANRRFSRLILKASFILIIDAIFITLLSMKTEGIEIIFISTALLWVSILFIVYDLLFVGLEILFLYIKNTFLHKS